MALADNRTQLNDCEDDTQTFATSGAQLGTSALAGQFIEGAGSIQSQHSDVYDDTYTSGDSAGNTFNLGAAGADTTIYIGVKDNLMAAIASAGGMIVVGDGTDRIGYTIGGSDAVGMPYANQYIFFKLDTSVAAASPGTADVDHHVFAGVEANLNFSGITIVGFGSLHNAKAQGNVPNVFIDNIRYIANDSFAASITGGSAITPETMTDVVGDDEAVGAGMFANPKAAEFNFFAPTEWGAATGDTYFEATDEQWYLLGDNAGSRAVGDTHFPFQVIGGTGTVSFELTRVVIINTGARAQIDLSDASVDILNLTGVTFDGTGAVTFPPNSATKDMADLIFNNCDQVFFDDVDVDGATFNGTTDALGALLWSANNESANQINVTLNSDGTGHGVHVDLTGDGPGLGGAFDFTVTGWEVSGYESASDGSTGNTVFLVDNDNDNDVTINVVSGTGTFSYERAAGYIGNVTVNQAANVVTQGMTEGGVVTIVANETVGSVTDGDVLAELFADANGDTLYVHNYEGDLDVLLQARDQGVAVAAIADDGGAFTDETTEANNPTADDMNLLPATPVAGDAYYFGSNEEYNRIKVDVTDANGAGSTITWEYWNGAWVALSGVVDGTSNFETTGANIVSWTAPGDWATTTVNSQGPLYYVRARLSTLGSANQTRARTCTLDKTRYLAFPQDGTAIRTILATGLTETIPWTEDTISKFDPSD